MGKTSGAVSAGHPHTTQAGARMLEEGGNAFDAILAAMCASCVVEPVLSSLGGGGFLLAHAQDQDPLLYDFFTQTPKVRREESEFYPILADFGTVTQEFHIGRGSIATPGLVKGLFEAHKDLGSLPMDVIVAPAVELAKDGVRVNQMQAKIFDIVEAIFMASPDSKALYGSHKGDKHLLGEGELQTNPDMGNLFEALARDGEDLFYKGDIAKLIETDSWDNGGHLSMADLHEYRVERRKPLRVDYARSHFYTNPAPSTGGLLIAFALELIKTAGFRDLSFGSKDHVERLSQIMALTNKARIDAKLAQGAEQAQLKMLDQDFLQTYRKEIMGRPTALRGTTHMSAIDKHGNAASLTVSNGEGCGHILPGTGVMLNNMLGEEDINPHGFNQWPTDTRMCSMMSPTLLLRDDGVNVALGSGGSNRIRTAVLQVLVNLLEFNMNLEQAVSAPRMHFERGLLNMEPGFPLEATQALSEHVPNYKIWDAQNLFFGGVHSVRANLNTGRFDGVGDARRGGAAIIIDEHMDAS
ncbi:Gamma-glutamyltranspeptidase [Candidatus Terasakiella magnetica]|uniref:Glutathione hydrolase proenzyme n=1 Tax=Candidatus Terasakiella magnetica TaxID=1867952 RepID=A0A1C3RK28_9PROT|nr:gamma-glutamyltransferase [Candidatus Terasakiella magnetica]SCA57601.1 Gamma-glutamyltranspeptidase [Candidatus Terasakiella magnetica]